MFCHCVSPRILDIFETFWIIWICFSCFTLFTGKNAPGMEKLEPMIDAYCRKKNDQFRRCIAMLDRQRQQKRVEISGRPCDVLAQPEHSWRNVNMTSHWHHMSWPKKARDKKTPCFGVFRAWIPPYDSWSYTNIICIFQVKNFHEKLEEKVRMEHQLKEKVCILESQAWVGGYEGILSSLSVDSLCFSILSQVFWRRWRITHVATCQICKIYHTS